MINFEEYLTEASKKSITRVAFVWLIFNATFMGWFILIHGTENAVQAAEVVVSISGVATALKLYQKGQEIRREDQNNQLNNNE